MVVGDADGRWQQDQDVPNMENAISRLSEILSNLYCLASNVVQEIIITFILSERRSKDGR
jgi:hypothetical protein